MIEMVKGRIVPEYVTEGEDTFSQIYNPDVLLCLANLSNDEVFTPPEVANQMLDMLPQELFESPDTTFLDPACKSGVFLREIAKRLIKGLEDKIPDLQERIDHICKKQLYGIAITELTSLLSRRSLYCSKYPNGPFSIAQFDNVDGNIRFKNCKHEWEGEANKWTYVNGKKERVWRRCKWCGATEELYGEETRKDLEGHAYEFIHIIKPEEIFKMKFDVICSNPPYQLSDGGGGAGKSAAPIYQLFVQQAKKLNPRFMTMIIPSRWFNGGKGLNNFRTEMLNDKSLRRIVDYVDSKDCFPTVDIPGGICYFLWEREYDGDCLVTNMLKDGTPLTSLRVLDEYPTFIRSNKAVSIVKKVGSLGEETMENMVSSRKPFGLESNTAFDKDGDVILRNSSGIGKVKHSRILSGEELLSKWKTIVSKVCFEHAGTPDKNGQMRVLSVLQVLQPNSACTESYLVAGSFDTEKEAENLKVYLKTKFARFLLMQMLASMNMSKSSYRFLPIQDFTKEWTDDELYKKYNLSIDEIEYIEQIILPMPEE